MSITSTNMKAASNKARSNKVPTKNGASTKAVSKMETGKKTQPATLPRQMPDRLKALDLELGRGLGRLERHFRPREGRPRSIKADLRHLASGIDLMHKHAALERRASAASMKHGKRQADPELAGTWRDKAECHRQCADGLQQCERLFKARLKQLARDAGN